MHKLLMILALVFLTSFTLTSQESMKGYNQSCTCISKIDLGIAKKKQYKEVAACVESAIGINRMISKISQAEKYGIDVVTQKTKNKSAQKDLLKSPSGEGFLEIQLLRNCSALQTIMATSYDMSAVPTWVKKSVRKSYSSGLDAYRSKDYSEAKRNFSKATEKAPTFALAWDMLGITLGNLKEYKAASAAYDRSIALNGSGRLTAVNKPRTLALIGDNEQAIDAYKSYIKNYPEDPEGYYKLGSVYHKTKEYDKALDNTMKSFVLYKANKSPFSKEALRAITLLHHDLKENNLMHIWNTYSEKYNLTVEE